MQLSAPLDGCSMMKDDVRLNESDRARGRRREERDVAMSTRSGQNGGGNGGRNYRLNWSPTPDGGATFGDWSIVHQAGWRWPWELRYEGRPFPRRHGDYNGTARFKTVEAAKRKVERYVWGRERQP